MMEQKAIEKKRNTEEAWMKVIRREEEQMAERERKERDEGGVSDLLTGEGDL